MELFCRSKITSKQNDFFLKYRSQERTDVVPHHSQPHPPPSFPPHCSWDLNPHGPPVLSPAPSPHRSSHAPSTFPPQDLCMCRALCLGALQAEAHTAHSLSSIGSLLKSHLAQEAVSDSRPQKALLHPPIPPCLAPSQGLTAERHTPYNTTPCQSMTLSTSLHITSWRVTLLLHSLPVSPAT